MADGGWFSHRRDDVETERRQLLDEGRELATLNGEFAAILGLEALDDPAAQGRIADLLDDCADLPYAPGKGRDEPSELDAIRKLRPVDRPSLAPPATDAVLLDRIEGAWLGRCAGCLLGKPVEGWRSGRIRDFLAAQDKFPLSAYMRGDVDPELRRRFSLQEGAAFVDRVRCMPEDDDTNYTMIGLLAMERHGPSFTSGDVAGIWLGELPVLHTFTAERVAYRNLVLGLEPPETASRRNPFREWIGAQIRADAFGYAAPGRPELAAEWAFRDAAISHRGNGIYGELLVAAMIAAAAVTRDLHLIVQAGLGEIPRRSRLALAIAKVLARRSSGMGYDEAIAAIHGEWDESLPHHWCHSISNSEIVVTALLWGEGDFGSTICKAVQAGFDTDCNGATAGSILGMALGAKALPPVWTAPLNDRLETGLAGQHSLRIGEIARRSLAVAQNADNHK